MRLIHLSLKEKIGYAFGDTASNFYWQTFSLFLVIYYTDVFGLSAAAVGTMMLATRVIDAISDPLMGSIVDRTHSRWGKFRPYLIIGIVPLVAGGVLTFTVPDLNSNGKLLWAYGTYTFMMLAYTFINVPYGALLGVMTGDSQQRTTLTSFRFIGAFTGGIIVTYFTLDLVQWLGKGDEAKGWQYTMLIYGLVASVLFLLTFLSTKERIQPSEEPQQSALNDIKDLLHNRPWLILFALALVIMMTISIRGASGTFYLKYYVGREDLIGAFNTTYLVALALGAAATPLLTRWVDKKKLLLILMILVTLFSVTVYFLPADAMVAIFIFQAAIGFCLGPKSPIVFSMYADAADYNEWTTGRRATAMTFAAAAFSQKLGGAMAGAVIGWLLASMGYQANAVQNASSQWGIVLLMSLIPGGFAAFSLALIYHYPLDNTALEKMQVELQEKEV
jgi:GPH family glycoside/pentoside/hexuronide:cation symporter